MSTNPVSSYEDLGVRPLINCIGTVTRYSGSLMLPEARQAMQDASQSYVMIEELMDAVGARLAQVMACEWGLVTNGCAAALAQVTAACIAGDDPAKMHSLPDTTNLKNEVIVQASHRMGYDRVIRAMGATFIEVTTLDDLEAAYTDRTAMIFVFGDAAERSEITVKELVASGRAHSVPVFVDAAAERPDVPNVYLEQGVDAVAYSGGKCLRGPQASGMVLGRKDLLQAAFANGCPNANIGRPMKAGKEEIMGLLAAVEQWVVRDHEAEWREWERRLQVITDAVSAIDSVTHSVNTPRPSNVAPHLTIQWDAAKVGVSAADVRQRLSDGDPRIEMSGGQDSVTMNPYMMEEGEAQIVARELAAALTT
ncbi:MAG: aminotransferase class V-fold PLP-dependent enzyme [Gemmatimonadetes bacterium]|nr:aminotransferase class V-fold PLP-dependent enzyme [Gemmatimonadota bacterium]MBT6144824.1 aminotransferase class V-fold PLP-dependent enzyme [Gemmatimonadota bacterium]MBT7859415.1 aminotransferase class V-fold PLP-dependent enzyme [Gemmatimonadota bacterium]